MNRYLGLTILENTNKYEKRQNVTYIIDKD